MKKLEGWNKFIEDIADEFEIRGRHIRKVFLVRFAYENKDKNNEEICQLIDGLSSENYIRQNTLIYRKFTKSKDGYPELKDYQHKFEPLLNWLEQERYPLWLMGYDSIPSNPYYIERSPVESDCYQELLQPGAFLRIKAPRQMGKTWLLEQILTQLNRKGYLALRYDFGLEDAKVFGDYCQFALSFCAGISELLSIPDCPDKYWSKNLGFNQNITRYFEKSFLPTIDKPIVLALDRFDCVFEHEQIAINFCKLLRGWHDRAQQSDRRGKIWRQLRLIVVHSTDVYSELSINSSPLAGVGKVVFLPQFTLKQVQKLSQCYQLKLTDNQIQELMTLVGGHPYLITTSFEYLTNPLVKITWQEFLQLAPTDAPPFGNHLRQLLWTLRQHPELATAFAETISSPQPIPLQSDYGFKLHGMGLVDIEGNNYEAKCNLYRQYFLTHLNEITL